VTPEELRALIRSIGRVPAERTTTYGIRNVFHTREGDERLPQQNLSPLPAHVAATRIGY
jgi:hypothetical protein